MDTLKGAAAEQRRNGGTEGLACREMNWAEMSLEQKIERLREVLMQAEHVAKDAESTASAALLLAQDHYHHIGGEVLKPAVPKYNLAQDSLSYRARFSRLA